MSSRSPRGRSGRALVPSASAALILAVVASAPSQADWLERAAAIDNLVSSRIQDPLETSRVIPDGPLDVGCDSAQVVVGGEIRQDQQCGIAALYFDVDPELRGAEVESAVLRLTVVGAPSDRSGIFVVNAIAGPWSEDTLSLDTAPLLHEAPELPVVPPAEGDVVVLVDVTPIVQKWASGELENHGLYVSQLDVEHPGRTVVRSFVVHSLDTWEHPTDVPTLQIAYAPRTPGVPPQVSVDATPDEIELGDPSTLTWSSTASTACSLARLAPARDTPIPLARNGELVLAPEQTSEYRVRCQGPGGSGEASATIAVDRPGSGASVSLEARPREVQPGNATTLFWEGRNVDSCTGSWAPNAVLPIRGSAQVVPVAIQSFLVRCTGPRGTAVATAVATSSEFVGEVSVQLVPPTLAPGESSEIVWRSTGADACQLGVAGEAPDAVPASGARVVSPTETTRYEILCGRALASFQVQVERVVGGFAVELVGQARGAEKVRVGKPPRRDLVQKRRSSGPLRMGEGRFEATLTEGTTSELLLAGSYEWQSERKAELALDPGARAELETRLVEWLSPSVDTASVVVDKLKAVLKRPRSADRKTKLKLKLRLRTQPALLGSERPSVYKLKHRVRLEPPPS